MYFSHRIKRCCLPRAPLTSAVRLHQTDEPTTKRLRLRSTVGIDCAAPARAPPRFPEDGFEPTGAEDRASAISRAESVFAARRSLRVKRYARAGGATILR